MLARTTRASLGHVVLTAGLVLFFLAGCSRLPGQPTSAPVLLPTLTLAPNRTVEIPTPAPSDTPKPVATPKANATSAPAPTTVDATPEVIATHTPSIILCSDKKLDINSFAVKTETTKSPGRITFVGVDGNVGVTDVEGKSILQVTGDANTTDQQSILRFYTYPTFSSDGKSLAFVGYATISGTDTVTQALYVTSLDASPHLTQIYTTTSENIPYLDWSPDSQKIAFLTISTDSGAMRVVGREGGKVTLVDEGSSAYWHWRGDAGAVVTHMSGSPASSADAHIGIVDPKSSATQRISSVPGNFKSPSYAPNAKYMLYVARTNNNDDLVIADDGGKPICAVSALQSGASFAWSPDGRRIAWMDDVLTTANTEPKPVYILDLSTGQNTKVHDDAVAFFWSPDGSRLAIYSIVTDGNPIDLSAIGSSSDSGQPALRIEAVDVATGSKLLVADTIPTRGTIQLLNFFDQYSRVLTPWSPDSHQLVFTSVSQTNPTVDLAVASLNSSGDKVSLKRLADALVAFWSPR